MSEKYKVGIITLSDKGYRGEREDLSAPKIREMLEADGRYTVEQKLLLPDDFDMLKAALISFCDTEKLDLVLTTGGTGFSPRDVTPEATMAVADRNAQGIAEYMRARSFGFTERAMLGRGVSVIRGKTLIVNLPGSPKAVSENLGFVLPTLPHGLDILLGRDGECAGVQKHGALREVSFIDSAVSAWLESEKPNGFCANKFKADYVIAELAKYKVGDELKVADKTFVITITGKKCFSDCPLFKELNEPCKMVGGVAFGKVKE